jgi:hypothetical protein
VLLAALDAPRRDGSPVAMRPADEVREFAKSLA